MPTDKSSVNTALAKAKDVSRRVRKTPTFRVVLSQDEEGLYSAVLSNLPGIGSCRKTESEAMSNVREAIRGALDEYSESRRSIPRKTEPFEDEPGAKVTWITLDG
jgi:predicted RNase H-like HicB family nuclease